MTDKKKTILAIDDDITSLNTMRAILEGIYEVSLAKNTGIAKTILGTANVDLMLLDMEIPGVSGMEFLETINADPLFYHIPIIIVSSHGTADRIITAQKKGALDFVVKPVSAATLLWKVQCALEATRKKISKVGLSRKLQILESSCAQGKTSRIEDIIKDLEQVYFDFETDWKINRICRYARDLEYNLVDEKVKSLLAAL